jgi:polar amino acid transport system substrate-binding protein
MGMLAHSNGTVTGHWRRLVLLVAGLTLSAAAQAGKDSLALCFENKDVPPWRSIAGGGLNFELLAMLSQKLDLEFSYQSLPWKRCLAKLAANEVQGAFSVSFSRERLAYGAYPGGAAPDYKARMHLAHYSLIRRKGAQLGWDGKAFSHVEGKIGYQLGYSVGELLHDLHVPVEELNVRAGELARLVASGHLAGAAVFDTDVEHLMAGPLAPQLEVLPSALIEKPYFLILSNKLVRTQPQLAERIWKGMEEVRSSPAYQKLEREAGEAGAR